MIRDEMIRSTEDDTLRGLLYAIKLLGEEGRHRGVDLFTNVIAPLNYTIERLSYENIHNERIGDEVLERIRGRFNEIFKGYERGGERLNGTVDTGYIKERLKGVVVIIDGLRYDIWFILKGVLIDEGWRVEDRAFVIEIPATTLNFRKVIGIEERGVINGKVYALMKWAEGDVGKRGLKRFLKGGEDIKFLHYNFIDMRVHGSTIDLYPLYMTIKGDFLAGIVPILKGLSSFYILSDHGFTDTRRMKDRYTHGGGGIWETILPFAEVGI